jgi:RNA ligase
MRETHFEAIFSADLLREMIEAKYVREVKHPEFDLRLYSYSETAQYERVWNVCTRNCRGLIVDGSGMIVARPFPKFFNLGEPDAPKIELDALVEVSDKRDGSLGILYVVDDQPFIATRGAFMSQQARHATEVFRKKYGETWRGWDHDSTHIFEIIYPENRIVLDYGDMDDLVSLGSIDKATGATSDAPEGTVVERMADVLARAPRPNAEGLVVRFIEADVRVKIKQDDYKALHRIITTCSARSLWEHLAVNAILVEEPGLELSLLSKKIKLGEERAKQIVAAGPDWKAQIFGAGGMPENFARWVMRRCAEIEAEVTGRTVEAAHDFARLKAVSPDRKSFAISAKDLRTKTALFRMLDGRTATEIHWMDAYPGHEIPFAEVG